jgi:hypothetical protein
MLLSSPYNNLGWPAYNVDYIVRGGSGNNYTRSQQDAQLIYTQALIWHLTGNTAYADRAVHIANVWSDLIGLQGDTNRSLAAGICGYLFAIAGDLLSPYPGWAEADKQAYKDMMMRVFYPENLDFLWRAHDTFWRQGGNTHYRLNWQTYNMASMAAIGVLCDNRAVYEQALDFFKYGPGNGRIERAAWYIFPDGMATTEEMGRDQGHNFGGWGGGGMLYLCQTAWNQGDDLFGYDNNRVLRALEYIAKYNLGHSVHYAPWHRNSTLGYTEAAVSSAQRGNFIPMYEMVYNHYVNIKGLAAPYSTVAAAQMRPEPWPNTGAHPSQVDWFGLGTLTFSRDPIAQGAPPSGLMAHWSKNQVQLHWWGTARATGYNIKRSTVPGGPYATVGTLQQGEGVLETFFTDYDVVNGTDYYYVVSAVTPTGVLDSDEFAVRQALVTHYTFDGHANDVVGDRHGTLHGGSSGLPCYVAGYGGGQAINLNGTNQYVQLPVGIANYRDLTIAARVYWNGGGQWQRIFDFGTEIEKNMWISPRSGSDTLQFHITTTRGAEGSGSLNGPMLPTGQWSHVAVTFNGDVATLYLNGKPVDTQIIDTVAPLFSQVYCYLGRSMWNADPMFNGRIDDFRIYNYALHGSDIWTLWGGSVASPPQFNEDPIVKLNAVPGLPYQGQTLAANVTGGSGALTFAKLAGPAWLSVAANGALLGTPTGDSMGLNSFIVRVTDSSGATDDAWVNIMVSELDLVAFYRFEGNTQDSAGLNHGIANGAPAYAAGQFGYAIYLDGVDDFVSLPADIFNYCDAMTVAAWVRWDGGDNGQRLFDFGNDATQYVYLTPHSDSGTLRFALRNAGQEYNVDAVSLPVGQWVHVTVTLGDGTATLYLDGQPEASAGGIAVKPSDFNPVNNHIGKSKGDAPLFNGLIDEFRVYNYVLSAAEVNNLPYKAPESFPWNGTSVIIVPGKIQAEEFDLGGSGAGHFDTTFGNSGGAFRTNEDVDIFSITDGGAGYAVGDIQTGEWLKYTVTSTAAQTNVFARVASAQAGGQIRFRLDDELIATLDVPNTGSLTTWQIISTPCLPLPERENAILTVEFSGTGFQLDWFHFTSRMPYGASPHAIPGRIEFEDYDIGGQWISYYDRTDTNGYQQYRPDEAVDIMAVNDSGTGYAVYAEAGEWLDYTCDIQAGIYTIIVRSASTYGAQQGVLSLNGQTVATVTLPSTGGWNKWASTEVSDVYLPGGPGQTLRFTLNSFTAMLNFMEFVRQYNPADITQDGQVDLADFATLSAQWLGVSERPSADIAPSEGDGAVDWLDLLILVENWLAVE